MNAFSQSNVYAVDAFKQLPGIPDKSVDHIITDPPYDFTQEQIYWLQDQFARIAREWVIVFSPPENPWSANADQHLFWIKPISTKNTSRRYSRFVEQIFVYQLQESVTWNSKRHWSQYSNVFTDLVEGQSGHPYEKPESLVKRLILNHTAPGHHILDPFCGSGRIPIVAAKLGRIGVGFELTQQWANYAFTEISTL